MSIERVMTGINTRNLIAGLITLLIFNYTACQGDRPNGKKGYGSSVISDGARVSDVTDEYPSVNAMMVLPKNPGPGESFRILVTGGDNIRKAQIIVNGPSGSSKPVNSRTGTENPYWRIDEFQGSPAGKYKATLIADKQEISNLDFEISTVKVTPSTGSVWKTLRGWDSGTEAIYSAWINALFQGCSEDDSWTALHEVTQNKNRNFLYNCLSLGKMTLVQKTS